MKWTRVIRRQCDFSLSKQSMKFLIKYNFTNEAYEFDT